MQSSGAVDFQEMQPAAVMNKAMSSLPVLSIVLTLGANTMAQQQPDWITVQ